MMHTQRTPQLLRCSCLSAIHQVNCRFGDLNNYVPATIAGSHSVVKDGVDTGGGGKETVNLDVRTTVSPLL